MIDGRGSRCYVRVWVFRVFLPPRRNYYTSCDNVGQRNTFLFSKEKKILMSRLSNQIEPFGAKFEIQVFSRYLEISVLHVNDKS